MTAVFLSVTPHCLLQPQAPAHPEGSVGPGTFRCTEKALKRRVQRVHKSRPIWLLREQEVLREGGLIQVSLEGDHHHPYSNQHPECSPYALGTVLCADVALPCHPHDKPVK